MGLMEVAGLNLGVLLVNFLLLVGWLGFDVLALLRLRYQEMPPTARALWAAVIVFAPYLGALAFFIQSLDGSRRSAGRE